MKELTYADAVDLLFFSKKADYVKIYKKLDKQLMSVGDIRTMAESGDLAFILDEPDVVEKEEPKAELSEKEADTLAPLLEIEKKLRERMAAAKPEEPREAAPAAAEPEEAEESAPAAEELEKKAKSPKQTFDLGKLKALYNAGWSQKEIASEMHRSPAVICGHVKRLREAGEIE